MVNVVCADEIFSVEMLSCLLTMKGPVLPFLAVERLSSDGETSVCQGSSEEEYGLHGSLKRRKNLERSLDCFHCRVASAVSHIAIQIMFECAKRQEFHH